MPKSQSGVICLFRDFQQLVTVRTNFEEVCDCCSEEECVLFFVPCGYCRPCEELRSLVRKFAQYAQNSA